ncbi:hypothetical protein IFM89_012347 [Coptis chinensis]|uniref:Uncharacterized protein n=1 Tax=Coptis chinensis TaxID=261450 RepID=A0A835LUT1_9MAGN|nr:hypothetical protein IFM89_012347 [Coptis chinensis]
MVSRGVVQSGSMLRDGAEGGLCGEDRDWCKVLGDDEIVVIGGSDCWWCTTAVLCTRVRDGCLVVGWRVGLWEALNSVNGGWGSSFGGERNRVLVTLLRLCRTRELHELGSESLFKLCQLVEVKDGGPTWIHMMDRSTPAMAVWPTKLGGEILRKWLIVMLVICSWR